MANTFVPQDVYALMNEIVQQATGRTDLQVVDTTTFTTVGETLLNTATENTLNAISTVIANTIFSSRPYDGKFKSLYVPQRRWGGIIRKLVPLSMLNEPAQDWNTQLSPDALANGNSVDMYKINAPTMVQLNFIGTKVLQMHITRFRDQLALAFHSEAEFMQFINAVMVEYANDMESQKEAKSRLTLINYMGGLMAMNAGNVIDLTETYNTKFGTEYTREQLLTEHLTEFMQHFVSSVKIVSDRLTDRSALYHANLTNYKPILHHTPKSMQRMFMYGPMFTEAEARVFSEIFNPIYLELGDNIETVNFWQSQDNPTAIQVKPNILNLETGASQDGEEVTINHVVGCIFDREALGVMPQFDYASSTPFNSAGGYWNMYNHWRFNSYVDYTENGVLFIMGDGGPTPEES